MCVCVQGRITAVKELDYEISNGHYTLVVTATDQCPNPALRLTSSTTVSKIRQLLNKLLKISQQIYYLLFYLINHLNIIYIRSLDLFLSDNCSYDFYNLLCNLNTPVEPSEKYII